MPRPVSAIPNLGPASDAAFARAGIRTAEEVYALGPDAAYLRLIQSGTQPHFIGYYALVMGVQGRPWNDCRGEEKKALRLRFDALKARAAADPEAAETRSNARIESALDEIGLGLKRR
ncbi:TfoX/Sxy family DNA transformation protein [Ostreiculturibacter nitratireducens]|uniref:TfoX/Sxy family DNA transformation protein n=1 Tax=Ostreiculturibacter nitratireducens TaxID=3075226 RepID=UPI0031B5FBAC